MKTENQGAWLLILPVLALVAFSALIRFEGLRLWFRRVPVVPRPLAPVQEGV